MAFDKNDQNLVGTLNVHEEQSGLLIPRDVTSGISRGWQWIGESGIQV